MGILVGTVVAVKRLTCVCVCRDFNAVRKTEERRSVRREQVSNDHAAFNSFIEDNGLQDLPLFGRIFTWFKGDGTSMSRIDRFLLSEDWCFGWPNCVQTALLTGLSDHCPLVLSVDEVNWGPQPTRMLKCWQDVPGYKQFVSDKWKTLQVDGWGGFVLREKLKMIKEALKEWHTAHSKNLPGRIKSLKERQAELDGKGELEALSALESEELHTVSFDIPSLARVNTSIVWQQSRLHWLREGDANSKYFHSILLGRRRQNHLHSIVVDGAIVEGVYPVRQAVFSHFANHFKRRGRKRSR